jgi:hypothetical protein
MLDFSPRTPLRAVSLFVLLISARALLAEDSGETRPAMIGSGPGSLVNLIDAQGLFAKSQRDAWVMFEGVVGGDGLFFQSEFSTFSPNSEPLRAELRKRLRETRFVPALYKGKKAYAYFSGTVLYVIANGRPHIRAYANQDLDEIRRGADFIAPQPFTVLGRAGVNNFPDSPAASFRTGAVVKLRHTVNAEGKTPDVQVISVKPRDQQAGETAAKMARMLEYLPPYRNGHPVTATFTETWSFGITRRW